MNPPILPGSVLGVLGGGQLGRMFALAARQMGYQVDVFAPEDDTPAGQIAYRETRAPYEDLGAVERFAKGVSVVTFEFENVPAATAEAATRHAPVRPAGLLLQTTQNRLREKRSLTEHGIPVATFAEIRSSDDLAGAAATTGLPAVLKTADWGYDGRGQLRVGSQSELQSAWSELAPGPAVLEAFVPFVAELSVVGARGLDGEVALYDPFWNEHTNHILDLTICPAEIPEAVRERALELARSVLEGFEVVGVLCVEMFLLEDGSLLVNELAPRPHNSGHVTIDAHECSQFEQQVRAICGLPLGSTEQKVPAAAMANLLGNLWIDPEAGALRGARREPNWAAALRDPGIRLHLYGKAEPRLGRKMGHLSVGDPTVDGARRRVVAAREATQKKL